MRQIDKIIIHCSATPAGRQVTVKDIDGWHRQRGFTGIGYHYVIYLDGTIHAGRDLKSVGAHCMGYNQKSIGLCYIGGCDDKMKPKDTRTAAQKASMVNLIKSLKARYPGASIHGHNEFDHSKACPSFDVNKWLKGVGI